MKKTNVISLLLLAFISLSSSIQLLAQTSVKKPSDWYFKAFDKDAIYGAEIYKAYDFLKNKKVKKQPLIAIVGYGMDVTHPDLKNQFWVNPNEKADGIDNDQNGLIDDINGWNFLGNKDGTSLIQTNTELDREFFRLKDVYGGIWNTGKGFVRFDDAQGKVIPTSAPANLKEYNFVWQKIIRYSKIGIAYMQADLCKIMNYYLFNEFNDEMLKMNPELSKLNGEDFAKLYPKYTPNIDSVKSIAYQFLLLRMTFRFPEKDKKLPPFITFPAFKEQSLKFCSGLSEEYEKALIREKSNRDIVGDDFTNMDNKSYGNNNPSSSSLNSITTAQIIAAERNNGIGINGIVDAKLMNLMVYPKEGDAFYKDIASAIKYATDKNADVIVLGTPNKIYPDYEAKWVNEALLYAEKKGVLIISPAVQQSTDFTKTPYYPNRHISTKVELSNFISVSPSDSLGNPIDKTNFSKTELDLFAPGVHIPILTIEKKYLNSSGPLSSAAVTAGIAGLIKAYYPNLTGSQIRTLLLKNVTNRAEDEVEVKVNNSGNQITDMYFFSDLCTSGGIINAYKAIKAADAITAKK